MTETISLDGSGWLFKDFIGEDWLWRNSHKAETRDILGWRPASVPGSVQHDLWQAGAIPDPYFGRNSLLVEWAPSRTWIYRRPFYADDAWRGRRVRLRFSGVDYSARFYLNGEPLGSHTGMYTPVTFEIGERLRYGAENLLAVVISPAPDEQPQVGYTSRVRTHKSRMGYWWDFCPRMVHLGIWDRVAVEISGAVCIEDVFVQPHLAASFDRADASVSITLSSGQVAEIEVETAVRFGQEVIATTRTCHVVAPGSTVLNTCLEIAAPELWWPNPLGPHPLYQADVTVTTASSVTAPSGHNVPNPKYPTGTMSPISNLQYPTGTMSPVSTVSDTRTVTFALRTVDLVPNETADASARPYTFVVNGRKIYARGWNWVPMDVLYGVERPERLAHLFEMAVRAGVNLFRVWGGGLIEKEAFYDLRDANGIMVWQEFIQSSSGIENVPPDDQAYVAMMAREAEQIVPLKRNHPSLVIWCGGNELQDAEGRPIDDEHAPVLAALHEVVRRLDPARYWLPSSPSGRLFANSLDAIAADPLGLHDVHGPWEHQGLAGQYGLYNQGTSLLHSEFGVEGYAHLRTLEHILPPEERWPATLANPAWSHTAAWWLKEETLAKAFGELTDLAATVRASQFLQHDGLRYAVEADRRRTFHNSGTLPWQFNEAYPNVVCTSAVDYFGQPKPAYYAVARAYRDTTISARFEAQALDGAPRFWAEVWLCHAGLEPLEAASVTMRLVDACGHVYAEERGRVPAVTNGAARVASVDWLVLNLRSELFFLDLALDDAEGRRLASNRYLFSLTGGLAPMLQLGPADLAAAVCADGDHWRITLTNTGQQVALGAWLEDVRPLGSPGRVYFDDNYLFVLPGETRSVEADWSAVPAGERKVSLASWNAKELVLSAP